MAENQLNLTVLALVALVAIIALVALVLNVATPVSTGIGQVSAADENLAGQARTQYPAGSMFGEGGGGGNCAPTGQGQGGYNACQESCAGGSCVLNSGVYWYCCR